MMASGKFNLCLLLALFASAVRVVLARESRSSDGRGESSSRHTVQQRKPSRRSRGLRLSCPAPISVTYAAKTRLLTYFDADCSEQEAQHIGERILYHWGKYPAWSNVYGPVEITNTGSICRSDRRLLANETRYDSHHRGNIFLVRSWSYSTNGHCTLCKPEYDRRQLSDGGEETGRRQLSATVPVTFVFDTDNYPTEMWFKIKDDKGIVVVEQRELVGASKNSKYTITYDFIPGTYSIIMKDTYGDGWCCSNGYGGVKIYDGIPSVGMDLIEHFPGDFQYHRTRQFKVAVGDRSASSANPADVLFPEVGTGLSDWITYYLQQEFHNNPTSCLRNTLPSVWIDLVAVSDDVPPAC